MKFLLLGLLIALAVVNAANPRNFQPNYPWNQNDAERMIRYSYSAYCHQYPILEWNCIFCDGLTTGFVTAYYSYDSPTDTAAYVGYNTVNQEIIVAFRGTQPAHIMDWVDDAQYWKCDMPLYNVTGAKVHSGFYIAYETHAAAVTKVMFELMDTYPAYQVFITGHSLGAAMAALHAVDLYFNRAQDIFSRTNPIRMITFGSPRIGNEDFYHAFEAVRAAIPYYRVTHDSDIVPHVPLEEWGFHHISQEVWEVGNDFKLCDGSGEDPNCSDSNVVDLSIPDHLSYMNLDFVSCWTLDTDRLPPDNPFPIN